MGHYKGKKNLNSSNICTDEERQNFKVAPFPKYPYDNLYILFYQSTEDCFLTYLNLDQAWFFAEDEENDFQPIPLLSSYLKSDWPSFQEDIQLFVSTLWLVRSNRHKAADVLLTFYLAVQDQLKFWFLTNPEHFNTVDRYGVELSDSLVKFKSLLEMSDAAIDSVDAFNEKFCEYWFTDWLPFFLKFGGPDAKKANDTNGKNGGPDSSGDASSQSKKNSSSNLLKNEGAEP